MHARIYGSKLVPAIFCMTLAILLAACGAEEAPVSAEPRELHWPAIDGSERYTVRLWSGYRLLMESSSRDTLLVIDPNLRRTMAAFDSLNLEVRGIAGWEGEEEERGRLRLQLRP